MDADSEQVLDDRGAGHPAAPDRPPWDVLELVALGAALASVGLMLGFALVGIDAGVRPGAIGPSNGEVGITYGTTWVDYTVPLGFCALLAAWWQRSHHAAGAEVARAPAPGRLRLPVLLVAVLAALAVAAGVARLIYTVVNLPGQGDFPLPELAISAGVCALALAGVTTQWLVAQRLLHGPGGVGDLENSEAVRP